MAGRGYIFDTAAEGEDVRLEGLQRALDPTTFRHLQARGLGEGWRCLEVGAGKGSVARWLCEQVGEKGRVVATDLSTKLLDDLDLPNLEVRRHDIVTDDLEVGEYDLIHARLLLEHLPARDHVLRKLAGALAPGGWLVVEDFELSRAGVGSGPGARGVPVLVAAFRAVMRRHGYDSRFARRLPLRLRHAGLVDVAAEGRAVVLMGGTDSVAWIRPTLDRVRRMVLDGKVGDHADPGRLGGVMQRWPALRHLVDRPLARADEVLADPDFCYVAPPLISAWGRRPAG